MPSFWFCGNFYTFPPSDSADRVLVGPLRVRRAQPNPRLQKGLWALYMREATLPGPRQPWWWLGGSGGLESGEEAQSKHVLFGFVSLKGQAATAYHPHPLKWQGVRWLPKFRNRTHTKDISYTWVDKLPADVKGPLSSRPGVLELPERGPDHRVRGPFWGRKAKRRAGGAPRSREGWGADWSSAPTRGLPLVLKLRACGHLLMTRSLSPSLLFSKLRRPTSCPLLLWPLLKTPELPVVHSSLQPRMHLKVTGRCYPGTTYDQLEKTGNEYSGGRSHPGNPPTSQEPNGAASSDEWCLSHTPG